MATAQAPAAAPSPALLAARRGRIDFHTHILPQSWPDFSRRYGYGGFVHIDHDQDHVQQPGNARLLRDAELVAEVFPNAWDVNARILDMDRAGVDVQVLCTIPEMFAYWAKADDAADLARILNNDMAEQIKRAPQRFIGLGTVPLQAPELAIAELQRCMTDLGFAGVVVGTHINEWNLDAPELVAFWKAAEELGACVFVHPNSLEAGADEERYFLPKMVGMPAEICHSVTCFLTGGVLDKFPRLKVCFAHGAGTFPYVRGHLEHGLTFGRHNLHDAIETLAPGLYSGRFFCDSIVHSQEATEFLLKSMSEDMVVFGSDYPHPLGHGANRLPDGKLVSPDYKTVYSYLEASTLDKVMGDNALRLLKPIEQPAPAPAADCCCKAAEDEDGSATAETEAVPAAAPGAAAGAADHTAPAADDA